MATGRTISANFLTDTDKKVISLCNEISDTILNNIEQSKKKEFLEDFGKTSFTRDGGAGVGAGKLQRDALCTRGRQGKAPFSNRNLRWHPLVVAERAIEHAQKIDGIKIEGENESQTLVFIVDGQEYPSEKVHELPGRYVALPEHWIPHINALKHWNDVLWTQNSCVIPALEACDWCDAVETYAILGTAIGVEIYDLQFDTIFKEITDILEGQEIDKNKKLPSRDFPNNKSDFVSCPMCKVSISKNAADMPERERQPVWQPGWRNKKRNEGEDSSIQIMHVTPLVERLICHNAKNVRYGHRWCNVSMTDHSLDETLDFMEYIIMAHKSSKQQ